jgi:hypothetical protein
MESMDDIIMAQLRAGPCNVNMLCRNIKARRQQVILSYKRLEKYGALTAKKEGNQIILNIQDMGSVFPNFDDFIRIQLESMEPHIKRLGKVKNLARHLVRKSRGSISRVNSKAAQELDGIIYVLNFIGSRYALPYSYADHLGLLPDKYRETLRQNQRMCAETTKDIVERLLKAHRGSEEELRTYLSWSLHGYMIFDKNFVRSAV